MFAKRLISYPLLSLLLAIHFDTSAEEYYWHIQPEAYDWPEPQKKHSSPELACRYLYENTEYGEYEYDSASATAWENQWTCNLLYGSDPEDNLYISIHRYGHSCTNDRTFNKLTGQCETQSIDTTCPLNTVGNPIDVITGYKIQSEQDLPVSDRFSNPTKLDLSKHYSSATGLWTHSYSARLQFESDSVMLIHADGEISIFEKNENHYTARFPETGKLVKGPESWTYSSRDNIHLEFDTFGKLSQIRKAGTTKRITHAGTALTITDQFGNTLQLVEDAKKQPLKVEAKNIEINYSYNTYKQLTSMTLAYQGQSDKKKYLYESPHDSRLLTGVIDRRGIRYATWLYDEQGRAVSSEHSNGAEKISIDYNADGSSTIINALGKQTRYQFESVRGIKRIKSIAGMPSAHCPNSNSTFTYNVNGLLEAKIDNNGNITTYTYNDRGLETSRTQASGTSQARTITTEWHPTLFSPVRINEPNRSIQYTYDTQGRQLSKTVTPH